VLLAGFSGAIADAASLQAAPGQVVQYTETFVPAKGKDAALTVLVEGVSNAVGEVFVFISAKDMAQQSVTALKGKFSDTTGKKDKAGSATYFIYKTTEPASPYSLQLVFNCPEFYKGAAYQPSTGFGGQIRLRYSLSNTMPFDMASYAVRLYLPAGREYALVTSPKTDYTLGKDGALGMRYLEYSLKGALAKPAFRQAARVSLDIVHGEPFTGLPAIGLWIVALCCAVGFFIFEYKKVFKQAPASGADASTAQSAD